MTHQATPLNLNFSFRSFGEDEITSTEELFIIDDNTIVFNQDSVGTAQVVSVNGGFASLMLHLKDGITVKKNFNTSNNVIVEQPVVTSYIE